MRNGKLVIGIDFDGTLADTIQHKFRESLPFSNLPRLVMENILFFIIDFLGVGQKAADRVLKEGGVSIREDLKEFIRNSSNDNIEVVIVTSNKNIEGIKEILRKNGLELDVLYSRPGRKSGFKPIDIILDDSYREIRKDKKIFWIGEHNSIFGSFLRKVNPEKVASNIEELKEIVRKEKEKILAE